MKEKAINGSIKKIALISIFLIFLVGTASATCDLYFENVTSGYKYNDTIFANENNNIQFVVSNDGDETANNVSVTITVSDNASFSETVSLGSIAVSGKSSDVVVDPTIRTSEGTVTYTAVVTCTDPDDSDTSDNTENVTIDVKFNGYKGKSYWTGASDITTSRTYDLTGGMEYYTQSADYYMNASVMSRSELWTTNELEIPAGATVQAAWLYMSYNWDNSYSGAPDVTATFNGNTLSLGTPYTDQCNFGNYAEKKYGLYPGVDVTAYYNASGDNYLNLTKNSAVYTQAFYPSTLVVIYNDANGTSHQIFINEGCDELLVSGSNYGTTEAEATAYAPFTGLSIDNESAQAATLYSFAGSAGSAEGNLIFNGNEVATDAWTGSYYTAYPLVYEFNDVLDLLASGNIAGIQGTSSGGMLALQQILVVEYR